MTRLIKNEWRPAARELPTENMSVLVCKKDSTEVFTSNFYGGAFRHICSRNYTFYGDPIENVEWWCPFPRAPDYNFEGGWGQMNKNLRYATFESTGMWLCSVCMERCLSYDSLMKHKEDFHPINN